MKFESPDLSAAEQSQTGEISEDILFIRQTILGNQVAFEKLVKKYHPRIFALVISYVKNSADAEDLTQEVFLKAYQNLSFLKGPGQFSFWLRQITRNHCIDWLRQRKRENHLSFDELPKATSVYTPSLEETFLKQEFLKVVRQAIDSLQKIERKLLLARYLENASLEKLQEEYGLSYFSVAHRIERAKRKVRETVQKLLGGFCALPGREIMEKIFLGGIEAVKLSLKTKLVTVGVAVMLGLGGVGVWHWHSRLAPQKTNVVHQQETKSKKATSASTTPKAVIGKPAPKVALQPQPAQQSAQEGEKQKEISDEERAELEQPQIEQTEKQDETASSETAEKNLTPDEQRKVAIFAELATFLPRFKELDGKFMRISQEFSDYNERYSGRELDDQGRRVSEVRDEYDTKVQDLWEQERPYLDRIEQLVPGTVKYGTYNGAIVITGTDLGVLHRYFAPKLPPWDGNPDYFSAKEAP
jgi:RNA polymerase sigma-70 factor (ECF subfamily)